MLGRMQDWPLLMHKVIDFAAVQFPEQEVASRTVEGPMHYTDYRAIRQRALKVAKRLERDGIKLGDRVATLAWNGYRHLEAWYGIAGAGAVYHTVNPRLFPEQIAWIMNDAEDRIVLLDLTFVPLMEALADRLPTVERYVVLTDGAHMPATKLKNADRLRGLDRRGRQRLRLEGVRRADRRRPLLHLRHDRKPEGRPLFASLEPPALDAGELVRQPDGDG